jgi:hypothetical protein
MGTVTIDELTIADEGAEWAALGFDVAGDACQLGAVRVHFAGRRAGRGIIGWSLRGITATDLDGLPTDISERPAPSEEHMHPNGVVAIDHIVAVSPAFERTVQALQAAGLDLRRVREEPTPAGAPRQAFFRLGWEILELIKEPEEVTARAGGPDRPAIFWGLALRVEDLDGAIARLGDAVGGVRPAVQPGRRIATLARSAGLAVPVALITADERAGAHT